MVKRRDFLVGTGAVTGLLSATSLLAEQDEGKLLAVQSARAPGSRQFNEGYQDENLARIAFPMGSLVLG